MFVWVCLHVYKHIFQYFIIWYWYCCSGIFTRRLPILSSVAILPVSATSALGLAPEAATMWTQIRYTCRVYVNVQVCESCVIVESRCSWKDILSSHWLVLHQCMDIRLCMRRRLYVYEYECVYATFGCTYQSHKYLRSTDLHVIMS